MVVGVREPQLLSQDTVHCTSFTGGIERQYIILVKDMDSVARLPCLKSWLCHMLAVWPWTNHLTQIYVPHFIVTKLGL